MEMDCETNMYSSERYNLPLYDFSSYFKDEDHILKNMIVPRNSWIEEEKFDKLDYCTKKYSTIKEQLLYCF